MSNLITVRFFNSVLYWNYGFCSKLVRTEFPPLDVTIDRRLEWIAPYSSVVLLPCLELPLIWDLCEPNVVTELPKPLFKKTKLRDNYSAAGLDCEDGAKLRRLLDHMFGVNCQ
ncbi:hypothetical protein Tco_0851048 [Tanacetum coccineum]